MRGRGPRRQRGAVAVLAAIWVIVAVAALGAIDIGNFYFARRDLQRMADLSASAAAQTVGSAGGCTSATTSANGAASANGLPTNGTVTVTCGRWDPSVNTGGSYFVPTTASMNAVQVTVQQPVPYFFIAGPTKTLSASAIAQATNIGAFSIATSVATLSGGLLNGLLGGLLNTSLNLSVVSYQGLANTQLRLGDLATALNVGSISALLNTQVTISKLAGAISAAATATALSQGTTLAAGVTSALGTIAASVPGSQTISIGKTSSSNGLLSLGLGDPQAGATATINALDALIVAAEIANGQSAVNLGAALDLSPIASISAQVRVVQPPVIAVGEAGNNADGSPRTRAHSAQVQVYLNVQLVNTSVGITSILTPILNVTLLNLPIYIEVGDGTADLTSTQCSTQRATSQSQIKATTGVAYLCIGGDALSNLNNTTAPTQCNQPAALTTVQALGLNLIKVSVGNTSPASGLNLGLQSATSTTFTFNGVVGDSDDYQSTNTNGLGSAAGGLVSQLASGLANSMHATVAGLDVTAVVAPVISGLVSLLTPVLNSLDGVLIPLLKLLGVQIGVSTVHDIGLTCGVPQLVY
ncbi:TadG family pilus assembly protein [Paraburkholderia megapolitana]|uniref:TadG family pilus assembly protein n=1 Tax=Paraburkholderia megapolitana TaxID=420953 RepID=UPI0038BAD83D